MLCFCEGYACLPRYLSTWAAFYLIYGCSYVTHLQLLNSGNLGGDVEIAIITLSIY